MSELARKTKVAAYHKRWVANNPGKQKIYEKRRTPEQLAKKREYWKRWRAAHPDKCRGYAKRYRARHPSRIASLTRAANARRRPQIRAYQKERRKDPYVRLTHNLRSRVRDALKRFRKSAKTITLLGCDIPFLMGYLEARFKPGMKWSNYGSVWQIDHHIPCAAFDLSDPSHQRSCFHYSNLRPLFRPDNHRKSAKLPPPHQAELL